jgi:two-component system OmpR family response regulator
MRLLVVEDEPRLAADLRAALEAAGYAVDVAHDGAAADFCVETHRYDSVVLDLGLPRIDDLTLLGRWGRAGRTVPVLLLTARGAWHEKVEGINEVEQAPCDVALWPTFSAKPFGVMLRALTVNVSRFRQRGS